MPIPPRARRTKGQLLGQLLRVLAKGRNETNKSEENIYNRFILMRIFFVHVGKPPPPRLRSTVGGVREGAEEQRDVVVLLLGTSSNLEDDLKK